jgi:hypothetical protein
MLDALSEDSQSRPRRLSSYAARLVCRASRVVSTSIVSSGARKWCTARRACPVIGVSRPSRASGNARSASRVGRAPLAHALVRARLVGRVAAVSGIRALASPDWHWPGHVPATLLVHASGPWRVRSCPHHWGLRTFRSLGHVHETVIADSPARARGAHLGCANSQSEPSCRCCYRRTRVRRIRAPSNVGVGAVGRPDLPSRSTAAAALSSWKFAAAACSPVAPTAQRGVSPTKIVVERVEPPPARFPGACADVYTFVV